MVLLGSIGSIVHSDEDYLVGWSNWLRSAVDASWKGEARGISRKRKRWEREEATRERKEVGVDTVNGLKTVIEHGQANHSAQDYN